MQETGGIPPYWTRFPSFFIYPFMAEPLMACLGLALLATLAAWLFSPINFIPGFFFFIGTMRYGFLVLERTARGHLDDRTVIFDSQHGGKYLPYKQIAVVMLALTLAGWVAGAAGPNAAMVVLAVLALFWPANTMVLALTNSLGESISPGRLWYIASRMGLPYLGLCGCLFLLTFCGPTLFGIVGPRLPKLLVAPVFGFIMSFFTVVMYRMMGYVIYQYHHELDIDVRVGFDQQEVAAAFDSHATRGAKMAALIRDGDNDGAIALAREALREAPGDHEAHVRLHRLLGAIPACEDEFLHHGADWLKTLVHAQRNPQAVEVFEALASRRPGFRPTDASIVLPLAEAAFAARRFETTGNLLRGFDKLHPGHRDIPSIYLLGARFLIEHRRDDVQAERVLVALRTYFAGHPSAVEAEKLQQLIMRLRAVG